MIAQLNCFTFGYLFVELDVGSPVGVRNFLSVALASARSRLGPFFQNWLPIYVYVDNRNAKKWEKRVKTQEESPFSRSYVHLEWFGLTCGSLKLGYRKSGPNTGLNTFKARLIYTTIQNHPEYRIQIRHLEARSAHLLLAFTDVACGAG